MKKILTAGVAAVVLAGSFGAASASEAAQYRGSYAQDHRYDARHDRRDDRREYRREQRREDRAERRAERRMDRAYARYQRAERRYYAGRYAPPRGYQTRHWSYGQRLPAAYASRAYVVNDYHRYGLRAPPHGYHYVRSGDDVVLAAIAGGLITAVIAGLFN